MPTLIELAEAYANRYWDQDARAAVVEAIESLQKLSVTNILLDVVPGDGSGHEVYAKSVDEVYLKLMKLEELEYIQYKCAKLQSERDALAAELERVKGQEPVAAGAEWAAQQLEKWIAAPAFSNLFDGVQFRDATRVILDWPNHLRELSRAATTPPTQPASAHDDPDEQVIRERDEAEAIADALAEKIAAITGCEIGEHTSANSPWHSALDAADDFLASRTPAATPAQPAPQNHIWSVSNGKTYAMHFWSKAEADRVASAFGAVDRSFVRKVPLLDVAQPAQEPKFCTCDDCKPMECEGCRINRERRAQ